MSNQKSEIHHIVCFHVTEKAPVSLDFTVNYYVNHLHVEALSIHNPLMKIKIQPKLTKEVKSVQRY